MFDYKKPITVTTNAGAELRLSLKALTIRELYRFVEIFNEDSVQLVAMCTAESVEVVDGLEPTSFAKLLKLATELNFPKAASLAEADVLFAKKFLVLVAHLETFEKEAKATAGRLSAAQSTAPLSSASAVATSTGFSISPTLISEVSSQSTSG